MQRRIVSGLGAMLGFSLVVTVIALTVLVPDQGDDGATINGVSLRLDYATSSAARARGLGGRKSLPADYGMLFVFPSEGIYGFYMKDMLVPIDMIWISAQGHVVSLRESVLPSSYPDVFYPSAPALYVLEAGAGFARAHAVVPGTLVVLKNVPDVTE